MKRTLAIFVSIALMLGMMVVPVTVSAASVATVTVETAPGEVMPGDPVTLAVTIANNPGFTNIEWVIDYDTSRLELKSINTTQSVTVPGFGPVEIPYIKDSFPILNVAHPSKGGKGYIASASGEPFTNDGTLFTLTFDVKATAAGGNTEVKIVSDMFSTVDAAPVLANYVAGGVKVAHVHGNLTTVPGQTATCTVNGWKDYYQCSCGKYYADAAGQIEIPDLNVWKLGEGKTTADHVYGDWEMDEEKHWKECVCLLKSEEGVHNYLDDADTTCEDCGYVRTIDDDTPGGGTTGGSTTGGSTTGGSTTGGSTTGGSTTGGSTTGGSTTGGSTTGGSTTGGSTTGGSTTGGSTTGGSTTGGSTTGGSTTGGSTTGGTTTGGSTTGGTTTGISVINLTDEDAGGATWSYAKENGVKTLTVACNEACVVIIQLPDGSFTAVQAVANGSGSYDFDISAKQDGSSVIIAHKGDYNLDGKVTPADATAAMNAWVNNTVVDDITRIAADVNHSGALDPSDATSIMNAWVNATGFSW